MYKKIGKVFVYSMFLVVFIISIIAAVGIVSADQLSLLCLEKGQTVEFSKCNPAMKDRTCGSSFGCTYCVTIKSGNIYCPALINKCNSMGLSCSLIDNGGGAGPGDIDGEEPVLTFHENIDGEIFNTKSILLDFEISEEASVYYTDNINGRGRWRRVCSNCDEYSRKRAFKEGLNDITFRIVDDNENVVFFDVEFTIDSKKPKIKKTYPKKGFTDGNFRVEFTEENPIRLTLHYGNYIKGFKEKEVDIEEDCYESRRYYCETNVPISEYNGQDIDYWFELEDIAKSIDESRKIELSVDITPPEIKSFTMQQDGRRVIFEFEIEEANFDEILYYDWSERRPRWRGLCSRLKDDICYKRKTFRTGDHLVDIMVMDEAGNPTLQQVFFIV